MSNDVLRATRFGPVRGCRDGADVLCWKGVPYAAPPVGERRWRAPVDPAPWRVPREATAFASAAVQTGRLYGPGAHNRFDASIGATLGQPLGSEDCLYLNIWAPVAPAGPRPVVVFVHGGSNICGYTADPVYDGAAIARAADVVVVTVAYRLGIFGFLDLAVLKTGDPCEDSGNFALLDIVHALRFVQADIAAFGGDARCVTLMGQSAGAVNAYALLTSPMLLQRPAPPLFHRLVALSGGISTAATLPPGGFPAVLERRVLAERGEALLAMSLVDDARAADERSARALLETAAPAAWAGYLRGRPAQRLLATVRDRLAPRGMAAANLIADGWMVASDPIAAIRAGRFMTMPVLAGATRDEGKLFPAAFALRDELGGRVARRIDDAEVFDIVQAHAAGRADSRASIAHWIAAHCLPIDAPVTGFDACSRRLAQLWFFALRDDVLDALAAAQRDVWCYRFDWDRLTPPFDAIYGAAHTFDLPFMFGNFGPSLYAGISFTERNAPGRRALSQLMIQCLAAFARTGDPAPAASGMGWNRWPAQRVFDADDTRLRTGPLPRPAASAG